ncbi:alkanesulfonate monooxygenase SsuD/methylene tetrahydromethanopterin reductase-like flavin-dependent oxidoreductase (luciferase family) [Altererythrobacter atlanticus]|uniref:LLM class flavin-dependent oxidoreductase n=1 Tax=Croceibacterium atlanticum TaxID=1267766 RepID=UPI0014701464|nr:LLM class flavin-dependent oxidoreductase [Croceibacterium atlanticum]MBB5732852.1 alkanesulfonate monooxygenase SsuD/methylene tetrahydromethanopterin reductase-like flavin-dependent oxidoreductase (luciferase family) [Croceibacterium atlanticum]
MAVNTYANHLAAWEELERQGFDGVAINEHHGTPFGMGASPNLLAAALSQRTERLKILVYANLLPIHEPLRLAEEIAMLDCMTNGRLLCGVGRGAPREYKIFNVPMSESRSRFTEAFEVMRRAWTDDRLSFQGEHFSFDDVSIWPRTVQKPHPPIWIPLTGSKESIEWAAEQDAAITPGVFPGPMREDTIRYFAECQRKHGRKVDPNKISIMVDCYVADSKEQAIDEYGEHLMYLFNTLLRYDQVWQSDVKKTKYYSSTAFEHLREGAKGTLAEDDTVFNEWTIETVRDAAQHMPIGTADEVVERILAECDDAGANNVLLVCNRGDMPHHMYMNQIRRIGEEVLPRLQAHNVTVVPHAEQREAAE